MSTQNPPILGTCPHCATAIATYDVLIEYETAAGRPAVFAECASCRDVVHPQ